MREWRARSSTWKSTERVEPCWPEVGTISPWMTQQISNQTPGTGIFSVRIRCRIRSGLPYRSNETGRPFFSEDYCVRQMADTATKQIKVRLGHSNNTWRYFDSPHNITVFKANRLLTVKWIRNEAFFKAPFFSQLWLATSKSIKIRVQKNLSLLTNILPVKQEYVGSSAANKKASL